METQVPPSQALVTPKAIVLRTTAFLTRDAVDRPVFPKDRHGVLSRLPGQLDLETTVYAVKSSRPWEGTQMAASGHLHGNRCSAALEAGRGSFRWGLAVKTRGGGTAM